MFAFALCTTPAGEGGRNLNGDMLKTSSVRKMAFVWRDHLSCCLPRVVGTRERFVLRMGGDRFQRKEEANGCPGSISPI
jgi:hypothetical protein